MNRTFYKHILLTNKKIVAVEVQKMIKRGIEKSILKFIGDSSRPVSTREISTKLNIAWHTADRYCLKLKIQQKVDSFTIGKATAWFIKK